jgi:YYY domain-containing protein
MNRSSFLALIFLVISLLFAAGLRFYNLDWDNGIFAHPDERSTVAFYAPTIRWPSESTTILDPRSSTLNPFWNVERQERRSYTYGHFPLYTLVLVANLLNDLTPLALSLPADLSPGLSEFLSGSLSGHGFARTGRALVALADLFSVFLLFLLGRRLYGLWGGVLAAAFSAFTVLQIQLAHFFAVDPISTTFTLLALYGSILLYDRRSVGAAVLTGLAIALAVASKFSALPVVLLPVAAAFLAARHRKNDGQARSRSGPTDRDTGPASTRSRMVALVLLTLGLSFVVFAVTSPFVLLDFENFKRAVIDEQGNMVSGVADFPFTRQYRNTSAYWYFIEQQLRWGMGWALGLLGLAGTIWVVLKAVSGRAQVGEQLALLWLIFYFVPTGLFLAKFMRYMVPVVPLFSLFGAGLIVALWRLGQKTDTASDADLNRQWANGERAAVETDLGTLPPTPVGSKSARGQTLARVVAVALAVVVLGSALIWSLAFVNGVYGTEHPWVSFARWTYANVPDGSCIAYEHWDDRMPSDIPEPNGYAAAHQYRQPILPMYDDDTQQKYELIRETLRSCDYVVLASNRLWRTIPGLPERYPMSTRYYEALFSGELGFARVFTVETPPRLGNFVVHDQAADESFTVYDHPQPIMFRKTDQLTVEEWDALLGGSWESAVPGYVGPTTLLMRLRGATNNLAILPPRQEAAEQDKSLLLASPVDRLPVVDDFRWNDLANRSSSTATTIWLLVMLGVGVVSFPLTYLLFHKLPDRGYGLAKAFGLLLVGYVVWLISSFIGLSWLGNTLVTAVIALAMLVIVGITVAFANRRQLITYFRDHYRFIILTETVYVAIYLLFIYLRMLNPDLWHPWLGGEKMLEIGFLNAIVKSVEMPPYDPFFAGGIINYYYYGLFLVGVLAKLTGIQPSIAFNLAVPTLAALTASGAFGLAANLAATVANPSTAFQRHHLRAISSGLLAVLFIVFLGNLEGAAQFMRNLSDLSLSDFDSAIPGLATLVPAAGGFFQVLNGDTLASYNYWDPTRVIPETINEFPFFSFLFADLHPHMIGIPFTILFLSLAFNWLRPAQGQTGPEVGQLQAVLREPSTLLRWLAIPFVLGAIGVINTWDLPTYLGIMVATFLLNRYRQTRGDFTLNRAIRLLWWGVLFATALLVVTYLLYAPFFANYQAPSETGVGLVRTETPLDQHFKIWGFFLFIIVSWLWLSLVHPDTRNSLLRTVSLFLRRWNVSPHLSEIYHAVVRRQTDAYRLAIWAFGLLLLVSVVLFGLGYRVPAYLLPLALIALVLLFRRRTSAASAYLGLLTFTGLSILLGVEFFFLRDFLGGGDYYRMNTLFKFFIQVWVMFGLVTAVMLPQIWGWAWQWSVPAQIVWRGAAIVLLLAGLIYPILGTRTRIDDRFPGQENRPAIGTLDGLAYMTVGTFEWPAGNPIQLKYDYEAIRWLQDHVRGTPILAEAKIGYYREGGMRVAAYTGLPSILGGLHQNEQRYGSQISDRDFVVTQFWTSPDPALTQQLIDELGISYIYVGQIERAHYGDFVDQKFEQLREQGVLELVFENEQTKIYKRSQKHNSGELEDNR